MSEDRVVETRSERYQYGSMMLMGLWGTESFESDGKPLTALSVTICVLKEVNSGCAENTLKVWVLGQKWRD